MVHNPSDDTFDARRIEADARGQVGHSSGYRHRFVGAASPEPSAFATTMEAMLGRAGARVTETLDRRAGFKSTRTLPTGDWPISVWECRDGSVAAVYESRAESVASTAHVIRYAQRQQGTYAGCWDGKDASDLVAALEKVASRLNLYASAGWSSAPSLVLSMLDVPFSERITPDHPFASLGVIHGIDIEGRVAISMESPVGLTVLPGDPKALEVLRDRASAQADERKASSPFAEHFRREAAVYESALELVTAPAARPTSSPAPR